MTIHHNQLGVRFDANLGDGGRLIIDANFNGGDVAAQLSSQSDVRELDDDEAFATIGVDVLRSLHQFLTDHLRITDTSEQWPASNV